MNSKKFDFEDRLVRFVAEIIILGKTFPKDDTGAYYNDQMRRASGSAALHFGESQGTFTVKDKLHKLSNVLKELKETRVALKILIQINYGDKKSADKLRDESEQLIAITAKMISNKLAQQKGS